MTKQWSEWRKFPDPRKAELLTAPLGSGCYNIRNGTQLILFGESGHVAERLTTLLPKPLGSGTRYNEAKRVYVLEHLDTIEYQTLACFTKAEAVELERKLKASCDAYLFKT